MVYTDKFYHGLNKHPFFEGWYFKMCGKDGVLSVIPSVSVDGQGDKTAYLQIITDYDSYAVKYNISDFEACEEKLFIRMDKNIFSQEKITLDCQADGLDIRGEIFFSDFTALRLSPFCPSFMGPFSYLSFLENYHDIISMSHLIAGEAKINGANMSFADGKGYIQKSWGESFPVSWLWYQSCCFTHNPTASVMLSVGNIPFKSLKCNGIVAICNIDGTEYRLATYYGARFNTLNETDDEISIVIHQKEYNLTARIKKGKKVVELSPIHGKMKRVVYEYPNCYSHVILKCGNTIILDDEGKFSGLEKIGRIPVKRKAETFLVVNDTVTKPQSTPGAIQSKTGTTNP